MMRVANGPVSDETSSLNLTKNSIRYHDLRQCGSEYTVVDFSVKTLFHCFMEIVVTPQGTKAPACATSQCCSRLFNLFMRTCCQRTHLLLSGCVMWTGGAVSFRTCIVSIVPTCIPVEMYGLLFYGLIET